MITVVLVDDEQKSTLTLKKLLQKHCPDFNVIGEADGVRKAADLIRENHPDLVFLDIEMDDGTGFDLVSEFDDPFFHFIFVTAHSNYAVKAFKYSASGYLLKPVDIDDLLSVTNKMRQVISRGFTPKAKPPVPGRIIKLLTKKGYLAVPTNQIVHLEAQGSYTVISLLDSSRHMISTNLAVLEERIADKNFVRVHRSYTINTNHLVRIIKDGLYYACMKGEVRIEISRRNKALLLTALDKREG